MLRYRERVADINSVTTHQLPGLLDMALAILDRAWSATVAASVLKLRPIACISLLTLARSPAFAAVMAREIIAARCWQLKQAISVS
jgi:hypothetical protein